MPVSFLPLTYLLFCVPCIASISLAHDEPKRAVWTANFPFLFWNSCAFFAVPSVFITCDRVRGGRGGIKAQKKCFRSSELHSEVSWLQSPLVPDLRARISLVFPFAFALTKVRRTCARDFTLGGNSPIAPGARGKFGQIKNYCKFSGRLFKLAPCGGCVSRVVRSQSVHHSP